MKISAVYALENNIRFRIGIQVPLREALGALVTLGYEGVELHISDPFALNCNFLMDNLNEFGLEVSAISTGLSYIKYGYSLCNIDDASREMALKFFRKYIEVARILNGGIVVIGLARGRSDSMHHDKAKKKLMDSLQVLNDYSKNMGVSLVLEPLNKNETNLINKVSEAIDIIKTLDNVHLLLDTYHIWLEEDIYVALSQYGKYARHIHVADTDRLPPGLGKLKWSEIIKILNSVGYNGYLSVEALMEPNYFESLKIAIKTLKSCL
ncbi:MAG: sugar phosphate isomerase/epimerase family protein [Candidatus Bathyarchaeia archaeon]